MKSLQSIANVLRTVLIVAGVGLAARWADAVIRCRELFNGDPWGLASESALVCLGEDLDIAQLLLVAFAATALVLGVLRIRRALKRSIAPPAGTFILRD